MNNADEKQLLNCGKPQWRRRGNAPTKLRTPGPLACCDAKVCVSSRAFASFCLSLFRLNLEDARCLGE